MASQSYLQDLQAQGVALRETLNSLAGEKTCSVLSKALAAGRWRAVVLSGMGSSLTALMPLQLALVEAGHLAWCVESSELLGAQRNLLRADVLLVLASQSGESVEIVQLIAEPPAGVTVLGITNTESSTLARSAHHVLLTRAGSEATVACKTYIATLAASFWAAHTLTGRAIGPLAGELDALATRIDEYWASHATRLEAIASELSPTRKLFYAGRGHSLPSALTAGLITKEATGCMAEGLAAPAFRHGPLELCGPDLQLVLFEGDRESRPLIMRLAEDAARLGARVARISRVDTAGVAHWAIPCCSDPLLPIVEILPVQLCTLALARLNGHEAGVFRNASKVTRIA